MHLANAIIVIKLPGTPTNIKTMHVADANVNKPDGYPWNSSSDSDPTESRNIQKEDKNELQHFAFYIISYRKFN